MLYIMGLQGVHVFYSEHREQETQRELDTDHSLIWTSRIPSPMSDRLNCSMSPNTTEIPNKVCNFNQSKYN